MFSPTREQNMTAATLVFFVFTDRLQFDHKGWATFSYRKVIAQVTYYDATCLHTIVAQLRLTAVTLRQIKVDI